MQAQTLGEGRPQQHQQMRLWLHPPARPLVLVRLTDALREKVVVASRARAQGTCHQHSFGVGRRLLMKALPLQRDVPCVRVRQPRLNHQLQSCWISLTARKPSLLLQPPRWSSCTIPCALEA